MIVMSRLAFRDQASLTGDSCKVALIKRYLFDLCAFMGAAGVERRSEWISDAWLAVELARDSNLDRLVDIPDEFLVDGLSHPIVGS